MSFFSKMRRFFRWPWGPKSPPPPPGQLTPEEATAKGLAQAKARQILIGKAKARDGDKFKLKGPPPTHSSNGS